MANLDSALQQLQQERKQVQEQIEKLDEAISVIEGLAGRGSSRIVSTGRRGRTLSAAARRRISEAQRARWAQRKKNSASASTPGPKAVPSGRKPLSPAARRRIAAAQKARWAKFRSQQKAA